MTVIFLFPLLLGQPCISCFFYNGTATPASGIPTPSANAVLAVTAQTNSAANQHCISSHAAWRGSRATPPWCREGVTWHTAVTPGGGHMTHHHDVGAHWPFISRLPMVFPLTGRLSCPDLYVWRYISAAFVQSDFSPSLWFYKYQHNKVKVHKQTVYF